MPAPRTDGANPPANRKLPAEWLVLAAVLLVGLLLRVAYLRENLAKPEFTVPPIDAGFHDYWARALATGDWTPPHQFPDPQLSEHPYVRPPGYPYFLSLIYRFAGDSYLAPRIVQLALGLVNALLAFLLAARWFGRRVGLLWAALMSVYWIFIYFEGELQEPALLICLLLSLVYVLGLWAERRVFGYALAAGILLGLAGLVRPNVLLFAPVALAWGYWLRRRRARPRRLLLHAAGLVLGVGLTVAPVTVRNYLVAEDLVFVSSNAGVNLFIGNHQGSHGRFVGFLPGLGKFGTCYDYPAIVWNLERKLDRSLKYSEVSAWFADQAFRFIREHPARFVALTFHRAVEFWGPAEISHNKMVNCERVFSGVLSRIPGNFFTVVGLALVGLVWLRRDLYAPGGRQEAAPDPARRRALAVLIVCLVLTYFVSYLPFFNTALYRAPIIPFVLFFGAYGLRQMGRMVRRWESPAAVVVSLLVVLLFWYLGRSPTPHPVDQAKWHADRGAAWFFLGRMDRAITECRTALRLNPRFAEAHHNLSVALADQGELDQAVRQARLFLEADPQDTTGAGHLAGLLVQTGRYQEAAEVLQQGLAAPRIDPHLMARAASFLATCPRQDLRDPSEARRLAEEACRLTDHEWPEPLAALADAYAADGQPELALQAARRALELAGTQGKTELVAELESKLRAYRSALSDH